MVFSEYGLADVLKLKEVKQPIPLDTEVLVKVHAASINSWDWELLRGTPYPNRLMFGIFKPGKINILGCDIAGRVEAVGENVNQLQVGDEVFGDISQGGWGGFAEYVCASENALALKPASLTFEQAAAVPQAAVLALQGLRQGKIKSGQRVLINGAGGGVGSFAIQLAKWYGAEVTGVDSTNKLESMRSLGADHVIDFTREDFSKNGQSYDLILDMMAQHSFFDYKRALSSEGIFVMVGGDMSLASLLLIMRPFIPKAGGKQMGLLLHKPDTTDLDFMIKLFEAEKVKPVIDKCFRLTEAVDAMRYFGAGLAKGKVVITMQEEI